MIVKTKCPTANQDELSEMRRDSGVWLLNIGGKDWPIQNQSDLAPLTRTSYKVVLNADGSGRVVRFADLHGHTDNSLLDGMVKPKDKAKATEYCAAITDHGVLYGFVDFYKEMKKLGKKGIVGFEAYCENLDGKLMRNHLILLAKNMTGYKNLLKLCSEASEHFNYKPHVTWELLEKYHEGIICTSACIGGIIPQYLLAGDKAKAQAAVERYVGIFGKEDFYIEIQRHHFSEEDEVRPMLVALAKENGLRYIATTDSHYLRKEDAGAHEVLLCMQTKKTMNEPHRTFPGTGYHIHSSEEMEQLFSDYPEALDATLDLADKVDLEVPLGDFNLPIFEVPAGFANETEYFEFLCHKGFRDRFEGTDKMNSTEYHQRFRFELDMVKQMGFPGYFLIVWDFISYARANNIYVGPGRGSAAGSLLAFCLGITDIDPIEYNLLFERFLNPERVSMPDVDVDFEHTRRHEVYEYCCRKYGADHVSHIITFGTMAARMAVKDVARVLGFPTSVGAMVSKQIPAEVNMTIDKAMQLNPELKDMYDTNPDTKRIIDIAKSVEGVKRHASVHACGTLVSPGPISNWIPTSLETDDETGEKVLTAQVTMSECEELSLLKFDFLGLKNMTAIHEVRDGVVRDLGLEAVLRQVGSKKSVFKYQDIPTTDRETYKMLAGGLTAGVFQLESPGMTRVITEMYSDIDKLPDEELGQCFERLIAAVALYRPGPMDYIPEYQQGMKDPAAIHYDCPEEEPILSMTYGVMVFQEQLMQVAQKLAGYSLGEADILRKGAAKKKKDLLLSEHERFVRGNKADFDAGKAKHYVPGCVGNGIDEDVAEEIWNKMTKFASYAFNRSHAACYAYIAYLTAYMSCHWPIHFYAAMLNAFIDNNDKVKAYLSQAVRRGIKMLPPDVNRSRELFTVDMQEGGIRFGLRGIANLNKIVSSIICERDENGSYRDMENLYVRLADRGNTLSQIQMDRLVFSGVTASFGFNKREQQALAGLIIKDSDSSKKDRAIGQFSLFAQEAQTLTPPAMEDYDKKTLMEKEYDALGIYLTDHPVNEVLARAKLTLNPKPTDIVDLLENGEDGARVTVIGQIRNCAKRYTKSGNIMYNFELQDQFQSIRCVVFPAKVAAVEPMLQEAAVIGAVGRFARDESFGDQVLVDVAYSEASMMAEKRTRVVVSVRDADEQAQLIHFVRMHEGPTPVYLTVPGSPRQYKSGFGIKLNAMVIDELTRRWKVTA